MTKTNTLFLNQKLKKKTKRTKGNSYEKILLVILFFIFSSANVFAIQQEDESLTVTGTVTDGQGVPLPGVNITELNTTNGAQTDFDGKYSITVKGPDAVLVFSYVGLKTAEIPVKGESEIDVQMANDAQALDEVVLVGYGKQKKISVVGAQSTVEVEELQQPVANIGTMLAGRVAGLTGVQRSGLPGYDAADIWIRGIGAFGNNSPLILVDGVERPLDDLDPLDIESFSILKDASATAVYGIRGANGVILIETKRGKLGKPKIMVDYFEGVTRFTRIPKLADGVTYMTLANEALSTRGQEPRYSQDVIDGTRNNLDPLLYPDVNWMDEVFNDYGRNRKATVNVSGGSEWFRAYTSVSYYDELGLYTTEALEDDTSTRFKRYNFTANLDIDITSTTEVRLGVRGFLSEGNYPALGQGGIFDSAMQAPPTEYPVMFPGGFIPGRNSGGQIANPYAEATLRGYRNEIQNMLNSNLRINQDLGFITEGLRITGMFSFDAYNDHTIHRQTRKQTYYFADVNNPYTPSGEPILVETYEGGNLFLGYSRENAGQRRIYYETSLNYQQDFDKHSVGGLLLFNRNDFVRAFAADFTGSIPFRNQGLAARATYGYDDKYFVEVNAGYNGSENFAPNNRYGFFPSIGLGYVISNEKFFKPLKNTINYLKLRYTDGLVGQESGAGRFSYLSRVDGSGGYDFGENPTGVGGIAETFYGVDVTWSESRKQDLGIEINTFNNDLKIIFDLFKERNEGAFLQRGDIPSYIGLRSTPFGNLGVIVNKGFDGSVNYNTRFKDLTLGFRGTFSYNRSKILENGDPERIYPWLNRYGRSLMATFGLVAERLYTLDDDTNGDGFITPDDGDYPNQFGQIQPGDIKYTDLNEDGEINSFDERQIGQGDVPALTYGFGVSAGYKNFDLSMFFQGQAEAELFLSGRGVHPFSGSGGQGNLYSVAVDRWTPENDDPYATFPRLSYSETAIGSNNNTQRSSWWIRDIDFMRLKTAEIGYTLPKTLSERLRLNSVRVYMRGTNLFTISSFDLWDPELSTTSNGSQYPNITAISLGTNIRF